MIKKNELLDLIRNFEHFNNRIEKEKDFDINLCMQCREQAIDLGNYLELMYKEKDISLMISALEEYCEELFLLSQEEEIEERRKIVKKIHKLLLLLKNDIRNKLPEDKKIIVFMPYKASMWDSLESIWLAAKEDDKCEVIVMPIPYFDKNPDGSIKQMHYEGEMFPQNVPIVLWNEYNLEEEHPDIIYIHNPYDEYNTVTSIHPSFYAKELKKVTHFLVYVPYFILPSKFEEHFALLPGVVFSDRVFVQNEVIRNCYIKTVKKELPEIEDFEDKIFAIGSPKIDKIIACSQQRLDVPKEWAPKLQNKLVVFLNTNVSLILHNSYQFISNLKRMAAIFSERAERIVVIWREHPLSMATIKSMRPDLLEEYEAFKKYFSEQSWGIIDDNVEAYTAISLSDCYYGAGGSLITLYSVTGKPMMVTDYFYPTGIVDKEISLEDLMCSAKNRTYYNEKFKNSLSLFLDNQRELLEKQCVLSKRIEGIVNNIDGTVGKKIHTSVMMAYKEG